MTETEFRSIIEPLADEKYREGSVRITGTKLFTYGVRTPVLRKLAKDFFRTRPDFNTFFYGKTAFSFEEVMLSGMQLIYLKDEDALADGLDRIIPRFDSWAHTDQIIYDFSCVRDFPSFLSRFDRLRSGGEFEKRSYVILLLKQCGKLRQEKDGAAKDSFTKFIFNKLASVPAGEYYVDMGLAWTLAELLTVNYGCTKELLASENRFGGFVLRKAAQKCRDSFRIPDNRKKEITELCRGIAL